MNKKAQYSRLDMAVWYALCMFVVIVAIGTLYSFEYIGDSGSRAGQITGAVVIDDSSEEPNALEINDTIEDISPYSDDK